MNNYALYGWRCFRRQFSLSWIEIDIFISGVILQKKCAVYFTL